MRRALGPERYHREVAERTRLPGVATGLAWTPTGGEILFFEASAAPGGGRLSLTGSLGEVMKESARTALFYLRTKARDLDIPPKAISHSDVHLHVPAGAIPKDGPSAGVAILAALASAFTGKRVSGSVALSGEITLRGLVLPVGGIKEKALAAARAGVEKVVLPEKNRGDWEEVPEETRRRLRVVFVRTMEEALDQALDRAKRKNRRAKAPAR